MGKKLSLPAKLLLMFFVPGGLVFLALWILGQSGRSLIQGKQDPQSSLVKSLAIKQIVQAFRMVGYSDQMIKYWLAISAHETNGWSSRVFLEANNLFGMTLGPLTRAKSKLPYGEGQAIFNTVEDSAKDQVAYLARKGYPMNFTSLRYLVEYMKYRGYFTDSVDNYLSSATRWYNNLENSIWNK